MSSLKFGTSGLRGLVADLTSQACAAYTAAFLDYLQSKGSVSKGQPVLVGRDLRSSSTRIADDVLLAIAAKGFQGIDCGELPTPALALESLALGAPAIMVTGSHIPDDRNGLKFYRPDGEIDKADEEGIVAHLGGGEKLAVPPASARPSKLAIEHYRQRYQILGDDLLRGMRIGVYQHSSVARDILEEVLEGLGGQVVTFGRADTFIPVDTEALRTEDVELARDWISANPMDAIVSTDGDADRPLIADETGTFLRGDVVGTLTSWWLGADHVVTPVTSSTSIEASRLFKDVTRTKVGSPYVIAEMAMATGDLVVGFEANGGVLLGSDALSRGIKSLPTRDAMLPIIAVLALARERHLTVSTLVSELPARYTDSGRLKEVPPSSTGPFLRGIAEEKEASSFLAEIGALRAIDTIDGVRLTLESGDIIHFRASGNAPELRCYSEAADADRAKTLVDWGLSCAAEAL